MNDRRASFLIVDDKENMLRLLEKVLKNDGKVFAANRGADALRILANEDIDAILCDLKMPDMDGLTVLKESKRLRPEAEFILMTAYATVGTAVEALKLGAYDYLTKPFEPEDARAVLLRAKNRVQVAKNVPPPDGVQLLPGVWGASPAMVRVSDIVRKVASGEVTTLILGETGTGKEPIARAVHELSPRNGRRFVAVNCAAIPPELLESELFGHAKGAFTGASTNKKGLFEEADGGSLFLDEIGDMLPSLQAKLTRVLEEGAVRPVGENTERKVDVRLIAATHRDLASMVRAGTFREDLWYRLNVAQIELPPLRERPGDVELLANRFLRQQFERSSGKTPTGFDHGALDALLAYEWPGNVRQLRSAIERACIVAESERIRLMDLPPELTRSETGSEDDPALVDRNWASACEYGREQTGRLYLRAVLRRYEGNVAEAARHADVERESFYRLLRKHGVDPMDFRRRSKRQGEDKP